MVLASLERVFRALGEARVRYLLVGGFAVAVHGHARATADLDLVVALDPGNAAAAIGALSALGYRPVVPVDARDFASDAVRASWIRDEGMVVLPLFPERPGDLPIDLYVDLPFDFEEAAATALWAEVVPGLPVPVVPRGILVAMKEAAGRPRDLEDVRILRELDGSEDRS